MRLITGLMAALLLSNVVFADTLEQQVIGYVRVFEGDRGSHGPALDELSYAGVSDTRVFDRLEKLLLEDADIARNSRDEKNRVARYIRALGFSGQPKYAATIQRYVNDKVYERYAKAALEDLPKYQRWNPIISNRAGFDPKQSDDVNRVANMLKSNDLMLQRIGAKRVYFAHQDSFLLEILAKNVRENYRSVINEEDPVDAVAWMVKALGNARSEAYRPLLQEVMLSAPNSKVRDYAKRALEHY